MWDRKTRMDDISSGKIYDIVANYDANAEQNRATAYVVDAADLEVHQEEEESTEAEVPTANTQQRQIYFSENKKRKIYEQYQPEDILESFILNNHAYDDKKLCMEQPTHISQRGGYYHLPDHLHPLLLQAWRASIERLEKFYLEEIRTPTFRLYVDIDIKSTQENDNYDIIQTGWLELITKHAIQFFSKLKKDLVIDPSVVVTECHSSWTDAVTPTAKTKSGYRLYFCNVYVDVIVYTAYINSLSNYLKTNIGEYDNQPEGWTFADIVDVKSCTHDRARMFGSIKYRRGVDLNRKYGFVGVFKNKGVTDDALSDLLKNNILALLQFTSVRLLKDIDAPNNSHIFRGLEVTAPSGEIEKISVDNVQVYVPHKD